MRTKGFTNEWLEKREKKEVLDRMGSKKVVSREKAIRSDLKAAYQKPTLIFDSGITRVRIAPMSVNVAWKGKKFKTDKYKKYCVDVSLLLPTMDLPAPPYQMYFKFGFSNLLSDGDNPIKPVQDIIAKFYNFNDRNIKRWIIDVVKTDKKDEFFDFKITHLEIK